MKNRFWAVRAAALLLVVLLCVSLCGCKKKEPVYTEPEPLPEPELDAAGRLLSNLYPDGTITLSDEIADVFYYEARVEVLESDDERTTVVVYAPVFEDVFEALYSDGVAEEEEIYDVLYSDEYWVWYEDEYAEYPEFDSISEEMAFLYRYSYMETELTLTIDENGNPLESYAFADAFYGGLLSYFDRLMSEAEWEGAQ